MKAGFVPCPIIPIPPLSFPPPLGLGLFFFLNASFFSFQNRNERHGNHARKTLRKAGCGCRSGRKQCRFPRSSDTNRHGRYGPTSPDPSDQSALDPNSLQTSPSTIHTRFRSCRTAPTAADSSCQIRRLISLACQVLRVKNFCCYFIFSFY